MSNAVLTQFCCTVCPETAAVLILLNSSHCPHIDVYDNDVFSLTCLVHLTTRAPQLDTNIGVDGSIDYLKNEKMWTSNEWNREAAIDRRPTDTNPSTEAPGPRRETEVETGGSMRMMEPLVTR